MSSDRPSGPSNTPSGGGWLPSMSLPIKWVVAILMVVLAGSLMLSGGDGDGHSNLLIVTLVNVNLIVVVALVLLLSRNLVKWLFEGPRLKSLRTRLVVALFGFSLVPTVLLFVVASGLLKDSVNGWFSPQVEGALKGALEVARAAYKESHEQVATDARLVARTLADTGTGRWDGKLLETLRKQGQFSALTLRFPDGRVVAAGSPDVTPPPPDGPPVASPLGEGERVRVTLSIPSDHSPAPQLTAEREIPGERIASLRRITDDYENFAQLAAFREPIKRSYRLSILVITLVILFSATWFGFHVARGITTPLHRLVEGTRRVAEGDLSVRLDRSGKDEVGQLVAGFNTMTAELAANKDELTHANAELLSGNRELESRRAYMEAILEQAATGVIALDPNGLVTLFNRAAAAILGLPASRVKGKPYREAFRAVDLTVVAQLIDLLRSGEQNREREITFQREDRQVTLQVHARPVSDPQGELLGLVVVFDDMTELMRAQKVAAWQEVAQRLAHEIKNPLTPIQLSVQRLRKSFAKDDAPVPKLVAETSDIILEQVAGLKRLVDEFSQFARLPQARLHEASSEEMWALLNEVAGLYRQAYPQVTVEVAAIDLPPLLVDAEQMRQVFTNLFENAVQAMGGEGRIEVSGQVLAERGDLSSRCRVELCITDNGPGVAQADRELLFEPYVTLREGGTGLGLSIVKRIVEEHGGRIWVDDAGSGSGAAFIICLPAAPEGERETTTV